MRLGEITLADDVVRLREIGLATGMAQGLPLWQQQGHKDWRVRACNDNVTRHMAPLVTAILVTTPTMHVVSRYSVATTMQLPKVKVAIPQQWGTQLGGEQSAIASQVKNS